MQGSDTQPTRLTDMVVSRHCHYSHIDTTAMADLLRNLDDDESEEDDDYRPELDTTAEAEDRKAFQHGDVRIGAKRPRPK